MLYGKIKHTDLTASRLVLGTDTLQAKGFFAIMDGAGENALPERTKGMFLNDTNLRRFRKLKEMSVEKGISITTLVLAALISDPVVNTFAQIGPRQISELEMSLEGADVFLTHNDRDHLLFE